MAALRNETSAIKDDTAQILGEIALLWSRLPPQENQPLNSYGLTLERYLNNTIQALQIYNAVSGVFLDTVQTDSYILVAAFSPYSKPLACGYKRDKNESVPILRLYQISISRLGKSSVLLLENVRREERGGVRIFAERQDPGIIVVLSNLSWSEPARPPLCFTAYELLICYSRWIDPS